VRFLNPENFAVRHKTFFHTYMTVGLGLTDIYTVPKRNDTGVAHYNFNAHQPILAILPRDVAERVCYHMVICYPTSHN